jgi:hypothetical protein
MAGLAHVGLGFAAKRFAPKINLFILILAAEAIELLWGVFFFAGLEGMPEEGKSPAPAYYSHSLFMAVIWSLFFGMTAWFLSRRDKRAGIVIGALVFSHWLLDFFTHPMTYVYPSDTGLPIFFAGSLVVGLGLWNSAINTYAGEFGIIAVSVTAYILTKMKMKKQQSAG